MKFILLINIKMPTTVGILTFQGSKIALVRSYLRVPQAAGQVKILIFLMKIKIVHIYANIFCDVGQVPILRYFEACIYQQNKYNIEYRPDSSVGRVSAFGVGGRGFESRPHHTKGVKMVLAAPLQTLA